jgi:hypothetical protein
MSQFQWFDEGNESSLVKIDEYCVGLKDQYDSTRDRRRHALGFIDQMELPLNYGID